MTLLPLLQLMNGPGVLSYNLVNMCDRSFNLCHSIRQNSYILSQLVQGEGYRGKIRLELNHPLTPLRSFLNPQQSILASHRAGLPLDPFTVNQLLVPPSVIAHNKRSPMVIRLVGRGSMQQIRVKEQG